MIQLGLGLSLSLMRAGAGGDATCTVYVFSDADLDELVLGTAFTGNLKVKLASDSETGIHPDVLAGRHGAFVVSTDVVNDPQWVQYEVPGINQWTFNGTSFMEFPTIFPTTNFKVSIPSWKGLVSGDELIGGFSEDDGIFIDTSGTDVRAFGKIGGVTLGFVVMPFNGVDDSITLEVDAVGLATFTVNGSSLTSDWSLLDGGQGISYLGKRADSITQGGSCSGVSIELSDNPELSVNFVLTTAYRKDHKVTDSINGVEATKYNDVALDYASGTSVDYIVSSTFNGVVGLYEKDGEVTYVNQGESVVTPLSQVEIVPILGASISDGVVSGKTTLMGRMFSTNGLTITVTDESTGGRHLDEIEAHWDSVKANYAADGDKVLCYSHCLGNDISSYQPFSSMSQANKDSMQGELDSLMASVSANGNLPILVEATFRGYDELMGDHYTWYNEDNGSKPFNEYFADPTSALLSPEQYVESTGKPFNQTYVWSYNYGTAVLENLDNRIHYTDVGYELLRRIFVNNISAMIKGDSPVTFNKLSVNDAVNYTAPPLPILLGESSITDTSPHNLISGANLWRISVNNTDVRLAPTHGYEPTSLRVSSTGGMLTHGTNGSYTGDGIYTPTLSNHNIRNTYGSTTDVTYFELQVISGLNPNQACDVGFASYKDTTENRRAEFRINGDDLNTIRCNAKNYSGSNVQWGEFTADGNGKLTIEMRKTSGTAAHWNGTHVIPK